MFNQELTNRQKRSLNAKLYDKDMVVNLNKLDEAQYRGDSLVPINTFGGVRKLSEATYAFQTPELSGTIDLINWLDEFTGKQTGIYQNTPSAGGGKGKGKTNNVVYAEIQQMSKRVDYRSHSYCECWGELALRHIQGLKDNMGAEDAVNMLGVDVGLEFVKELKEIKLDRDDIIIMSTKQQAAEDALKKAQREKALGMLADDQGINQDFKRRQILGSIGSFDPEEIEDALDIRGQGEEKSQAGMADEAIKDLLKKKTPEIYWNATILYLRRIMDFAMKHRVYLEDKGIYESFPKFVTDNSQMVMENMAQLAMRMKGLNPAGQGGDQPGQPQPPMGGGQPAGGKGAPTAQPTPQPNGQAGKPSLVQVNQK
jgi:hypothetical protein